MNKIQAIIFDMDGVISDTQKLHAKVESRLLREYGIDISPQDITKKYAGVKTSEFFEELLRVQKIPYNLNLLMQEKWKQIEALADNSVDPIDGAIDLIKYLHSMGYKLAVASASNLNYVRTVIYSLNLNNYFDFLASSDMVTRGKPDPEIFLLASSKLGVNPVNCLVIEDGVSGMRGAVSANMKCIGLVNSREGKYPTKNLVLSLKEITPQYIENLM